MEFSGVPAIEVTEVTKEKICFILRNVDISVANALRRVMIAEVPTLAIELVTIHENSSVLHDEFLAHRLGLLPIDSSRIRDLKYKEECSCSDRCRQCSVEFQLDVVCREDQGLLVTHLDLLGMNPDPRSPMPVPKMEEIAHDRSKKESGGIVIAKLKKNQKLKMDMVATKGIGKLHAKWIPCATAVFQYEPDVQINEKLLETVPSTIQQDIARSCPRNVFCCEGDAFTPHTLAVANRMACIFCDECLTTAKDKGYPDLISISQKPNVFRFIVEKVYEHNIRLSTGAMPAEQIVDLAFEILEKKIQTTMTEISKLEGFKRDEVDQYKFDRGGSQRSDIKRERGGWDEGFTLDLS